MEIDIKPSDLTQGNPGTFLERFPSFPDLPGGIFRSKPMEKRVFFENLKFYLFTGLGSNMGASWRHLWATLAAIRAILGRLGAIWEALRINLGSLEASCVRLEDVRSHFRLILQYLGAIFGPFADVLGSHCHCSLSFRSSVVLKYVLF